MPNHDNRLLALERHLRGDEPVSWEPPEQPLHIIHFATSEHYLNKSLFPRQATALKVMALAEELLTDHDYRVIAEWESGFSLTDSSDGTEWSGTRGTPADLLKRLGWNRARRRRWFPQIELLFGRRGSKNFLVTIFMAWVLWQFISKEDPHKTYGIDPLKRISALVFAGKKDAAIRNQVRDLVQVICNSPAFAAFHPIPSSDGVVLFTPKQIAAGVDVTDRTQALVEIRAAETTLAGSRGPATFLLGLDEFAFVQGAGSTVNSTELFEAAVPGTAQFSGDAPIVQTTSPWDQQGQAWKTYQLAMATDPAGRASYPDILMLQLPSWAMYTDHEIADSIDMWPGGPRFEGGLRPIISDDEALQAMRAANPEAYAVEIEAQWRQSQFAYLTPDFVDRLFSRPVVMQTKGSLGTIYVAHGDPSLSQANFGFAIAHVEKDEHGHPHVFFDLIRHWAPSDFPDNIVNYIQIKEQILGYIQDFGIQTLSFDQWNSASIIQELRSQAEGLHLPRRPNIIERFATKDLNLKVYEVFKTAIGHGIVHAPEYALARAELRGLQFIRGRVEPSETGDVRTKDVADAMAHAVYTLIGEDATSIFERLANFPVRGMTLPGPTPPFRDPDEDVFDQLRNPWEGRGPGGMGGAGAPRRPRGPRPGGGRPNFGNRPNDDRRRPRW